MRTLFLHFWESSFTLILRLYLECPLNVYKPLANFILLSFEDLKNGTPEDWSTFHGFKILTEWVEVNCLHESIIVWLLLRFSCFNWKLQKKINHNLQAKSKNWAQVFKFKNLKWASVPYTIFVNNSILPTFNEALIVFSPWTKNA